MLDNDRNGMVARHLQPGLMGLWAGTPAPGGRHGGGPTIGVMESIIMGKDTYGTKTLLVPLVLLEPIETLIIKRRLVNKSQMSAKLPAIKDLCRSAS